MKIFTLLLMIAVTFFMNSCLASTTTTARPGLLCPSTLRIKPTENISAYMSKTIWQGDLFLFSVVSTPTPLQPILGGLSGSQTLNVGEIANLILVSNQVGEQYTKCNYQLAGITDPEKYVVLLFGKTPSDHTR